MKQTEVTNNQFLCKAESFQNNLLSIIQTKKVTFQTGDVQEKRTECKEDKK